MSQTSPLERARMVRLRPGGRAANARSRTPSAMCACAARSRAIAARIPPATPISASRTRTPASTPWSGRAPSRACASSRRRGWRSSPPGKLTTFPGKSNYQIVIESLEPAGAGALMALLEERRRKLPAEGLFDAARKRRCPTCRASSASSPRRPAPSSATSCTASTTAFPAMCWSGRCACRARPAPAEVAAAIRGFNALPTGGHDPASGCADRRARRRLDRGPLGLQRRGGGARRRRERRSR